MPAHVDRIDIAWLLVAAALVLFMQAGFTALESGLVRSKNSINVAIKNFTNFLVAAALFWLFGFALMFGHGLDGLIGSSGFFFDSSRPFVVAFFVFQLGFIGTATTLISGAVAERMRFWAYVALATYAAAIAYPFFGNWAWGNGDLLGGSDGWLRRLGFIDFAGSTVVHSLGGWVALAAIIILGPRIGRFGPHRVAIRGHDLPLATLGVFILWVGWYGFNGGSTFGLTRDVPSIILATTIAAAFGGIGGLALTWRLDERPDVTKILNGALAGLVGITASANIMVPWRAAIVGVTAAFVMQACASLLDRLEIDDAVGAVPVHLAAGIWGTLAVALLGDVHGFRTTSSRLTQTGIQLVGIGTCCVWGFGLTFVVLWLIDRVWPFRIGPAGELAGLNIAEHGAATELADLLSDMDEHRQSGDIARPVRVEPHTEVGQIAAEYNRVLAVIDRRTSSLQLLQRTAAAANESPSIAAALAITLEEVRRFTGWPVAHAFVTRRDDPGRLVSAGVWSLSDGERYGAFRTATEAEPLRAGVGLPGLAFETGRPVIVVGNGQPGIAEARLDTGDGEGWEPTVIPIASARGQRTPEWSDLGLRGALAIPVLAGSDPVAVLEFFAEEPLRPGATCSRSC